MDIIRIAYYKLKVEKVKTSNRCMHRPVERYTSATWGVTDQSVNFHISFGMIVLQKSKYTAGGMSAKRKITGPL